MGYVIAAYAVVLGGLLAYGLRLQLQRSALMRRERAERGDAPGDPLR